VSVFATTYHDFSSQVVHVVLRTLNKTDTQKFLYTEISWRSVEWYTVRITNIQTTETFIYIYIYRYIRLVNDRDGFTKAIIHDENIIFTKRRRSVSEMTTRPNRRMHGGDLLRGTRAMSPSTVNNINRIRSTFTI